VTAALEAVGVTKSFGGLVALSDVSVRIDPGEAVGVVGPNGAGKTTLFDCLSGVLAPDVGEVRIGGIDVSHATPTRRARLGLARTFQRVELFVGMTARGHLLLAERVRAGGGSLWRDVTGRGGATRTEQAAAAGMLRLLGLEDVADQPVEALSLGHRRLVELGRALAARPRVLLLDEPTAGLDPPETVALRGVLDAVRSDRGTAVLVVEHDLDFVNGMAERLVVLDHGTVLATGTPSEVFAHPAVRHAYLGTGAP